MSEKVKTKDWGTVGKFAKQETEYFLPIRYFMSCYSGSV